MGTEVHCKSFSRGYHSMRDPNESSNGIGWPLFCGDNTTANGQYYNQFMQRTFIDGNFGYGKDILKQKMLEHEAIFKDQVNELHRLYGIQRNMMEEIRRKEPYKHQVLNEASPSSSLLARRIPYEDAWKWHIPSFQVPNAGHDRMSFSAANSPVSFTKGNSAQVDPALLNGHILACDLLESRPLKVRKKLFDLHLPADDYIDNEDGIQFQRNKIPEMPKFAIRNRQNVTESTVNCLGSGGKIDCQWDALASHSRLKNSVELADLNEPIQIDEATESSSAEFIDKTTYLDGLNLSEKKKTDSLIFPKEMGWSYYGSNNGTLNHLYVDGKGEGSACFSNADATDQCKPNLKSVSQCFQQDRSSVTPHPTLVMLGKPHQSSGVLPSDCVGEDMLRERRDYFNYNQGGQVVNSCLASPFTSLNSSNLTNSWSQSPLSQGMPINSLPQKFTEVDVHPTSRFNSNIPFKNSQSSTQSRDLFGKKWCVNGSYNSYNPGSSNLPNQNGFHYGSYSGSKELPACVPSNGCDLLNCNQYDNLASECSISHGFEKSKRLNFTDLKSAKDLNLNVAFPNDSFDEAVSLQDPEIITAKNKHDDHPPILPWFRDKPSCKNEVIDARKDLKSPNLDFDAKVGRQESLSTQKILGFPILEISSKKELLAHVPRSPSLAHSCEENIRSNGRKRVIDINVACDSSIPEPEKTIDAEVPATGQAVDTNIISFRNHIDLNLCIDEEEEQLAPSVENHIVSVKVALDIDLEAPIVPENEECVPLTEEQGQLKDPLKLQPNKTGQTDDEAIRLAAEAIVAISSSASHKHAEDTTCNQSDDTLANPLLWFVEIASSFVDNLENNCENKLRVMDGRDIRASSCNEMDDFEALTLQLEETKEEDYMPKPFVPEFQKEEETATSSLPNRPRRGQARRGRQRRDFQRDILPGLATLSRHEVTEDLQTFGGMMRATGQTWSIGLTRRSGARKGAGRGRRRSVVEAAPPVVAMPACTPLVQQINSIEVGLEDRSLTGWGKTTRRPRRQRCPAGNPLAPLT